MTESRLKIALFIDFDNIEIGVKTTLGGHFDVGAVLEAMKERGEVVTKVAYGDWTRAGDYSRSLTQHAIQMVQRNLTPGGDKNGADINLALDALEMAFTHSHINAFVIVGGDSDFMALVEKLKLYDRQVFVVGGRAFTSMILQKNCTEFIAYENLIGRKGSSSRGGASKDVKDAMPLVRRALKVLTDREVTPQLGVLKSTLLQLDSTFSEREFGVSTFRDFVQKLERAGGVTLRGDERSLLVELKESPSSSSDAGQDAPTSSVAAAAPVPTPVAPAQTQAANGEPASASDSGSGVPGASPAQLAEGYEAIRAIFLRPGLVTRWPLYVRQAKQVIRAADEQFDERRFGFNGIVDALRYSQREGLFRLDRDRQGVIRIYPGSLLVVTDETESGEPGQSAESSGRPDSAAPLSDDATEPVLAGMFEGPADGESTDDEEQPRDALATSVVGRDEESTGRPRRSRGGRGRGRRGAGGPVDGDAPAAPAVEATPDITPPQAPELFAEPVGDTDDAGLDEDGDVNGNVAPGASTGGSGRAARKRPAAPRKRVVKKTARKSTRSS